MGTSIDIPQQRGDRKPSEFFSLDDSLFLQQGGGINCLVFHTSDRIILINTNRGQGAQELREIAEPYLAKRHLIIVNTSPHEVCTGGNGLYPQPHVIYDVEKLIDLRQTKIPVILNENKMSLGLGSERMEFYCLNNYGPKLVIYFAQRKLLYLGELFYNKTFPPILRAQDVVEWARNLQTILQVFSPDQIVPAKGPIATKTEFQEFLDYLLSIMDHTQDPKTLKVKFDKFKTNGEFDLASNVSVARQK